MSPASTWFGTLLGFVRRILGSWGFRLLRRSNHRGLHICLLSTWFGKLSGDLQALGGSARSWREFRAQFGISGCKVTESWSHDLLTYRRSSLCSCPSEASQLFPSGCSRTKSDTYPVHRGATESDKLNPARSSGTSISSTKSITAKNLQLAKLSRVLYWQPTKSTLLSSTFGHSQSLVQLQASQSIWLDSHWTNSTLCLPWTRSSRKFWVTRNQNVSLA